MGRRSVLLRKDGIVHDCVEVQRSWRGTRTPHVLHDQKVLDVSVEDLPEDVVSINGLQRHVAICKLFETPSWQRPSYLTIAKRFAQL